MTAAPSGFVELFGDLATSHVSDALDHLGHAGQAAGIRPIAAGLRVVGPAFTVRFVPCEPGEGALGDYIDDVPAGSVLVLDNAGRQTGTVWGDVLTQTARTRGIAGTVVDGVCRDTAGAAAAGYPLFAGGTWMRTGNGRVRCEARGVTVALGGVRVRPDDVVLGDADGVVIVPLDRAEEVVEVANRIRGMEERIVAAVRAGASVASARAGLQRPGLKGARP